MESPGTVAYSSNRIHTRYTTGAVQLGPRDRWTFVFERDLITPDRRFDREYERGFRTELLHNKGKGVMSKTYEHRSLGGQIR